MKVLITGATGTIGKEVLHQALIRSEVTSVIALTRRPLPPSVNEDPKLSTIIIEDFMAWPIDVLDEIKDADAMLWALGTSDSNRGPNLEFPMAFQDAFIETLRREPRVSGRPRFRYVHLSGKFVVQDQTKPLWLLETPRKIKGLAETRAIATEKDHADLWRSFVVKPSGVLARSSVLGTVLEFALGRDWVVRGDELGAYMVDLAVRSDDEGVAGEEVDGLIFNGEIVSRGRDLLSTQRSLGS